MHGSEEGKHACLNSEVLTPENLLPCPSLSRPRRAHALLLLTRCSAPAYLCDVHTHTGFENISIIYSLFGLQ